MILAAFRVRSFRFQWPADLLTSGAFEMETLILGWYVMVLWYGLLLGFGHVQTMSAGLLVLLLAGFVQSVAMISMTATLLAAAGDRFRARVMGVRMLAVYGMAPGLMGSGVLIERVGYSATIGAFCAVGLVFTLLIAIRWRASVWQRRRALPA